MVKKLFETGMTIIEKNELRNSLYRFLDFTEASSLKVRKYHVNTRLCVSIREKLITMRNNLFLQ